MELGMLYQSADAGRSPGHSTRFPVSLVRAAPYTGLHETYTFFQFP
jgi:hypothetical protein